MTRYKKIISILIFIFFVFGCDSSNSQNSNNNQSTVHLKDEFQESDEINITKAILEIEKQLGENQLDTYIAKDNKDIFVLINHRFLSELLNFDITKNIPELRTTIASYPDAHIIKVVPLSGDILLYQQQTPVNLTYVHIYNYILQKEIATYGIWYNSNNNLNISKDELSFVVDDIKIDIKNLYREIVPSKRNIYRDDIKEVVIDSINNLIWQDDINTGDKTYSLEKAITICQTKDGYNWRLPTVKDIHMLMTQQPKPFNYPLFLNQVNGEYLLQTNTTFDDVLGVYSIDNSSNEYSKYLNFTFYRSTNWQGYVRCVANYNK